MMVKYFVACLSRTATCCLVCVAQAVIDVVRTGIEAALAGRWSKLFCKVHESALPCSMPLTCHLLLLDVFLLQAVIDVVRPGIEASLAGRWSNNLQQASHLSPPVA
jgi:hypothetical protein